MVQGTASDSGKSTIVMALCRIFTNLGYKCAPFKSQNMSLNSFVTSDGKEIARSQVIQARACKIIPNILHNPILIKPKGDNTSQLILNGKPYIDYQINEFYEDLIPKLVEHVDRSLKLLINLNDLVIIEGAGSPAEINLYDKDIANMFVAKLVNSPVIIVGDIERGGVFASLYGTVKLIPKPDRDLIKGFLINKFRGDVSLLHSGIEELSTLLSLPSFGIIPYISEMNIPSEDSMNIKNSPTKILNDTDQDHKKSSQILNIHIIRLPKISNFTDFEPFLLEENVNIKYSNLPAELDTADVIFIPGTKNTIDDLAWLKTKGFADKIIDLRKKGVIIFGICGGFQMLGENLIDNAIESNSHEKYQGIGLLPLETYFKDYNKITKQVELYVKNLEFIEEPLIITGYEIHMGIIKSIKKENLCFLSPQDYNHDKTLEDNIISYMNKEKNIFGTLVHGIWENDSFRSKFIKYFSIIRNKKIHTYKQLNYNDKIDSEIDKIASIISEYVDIIKIKNLVGLI